LIYIDYSGKTVLLNEKEVLDALAFHKNKVRFVPQEIDNGDTASINKLSAALGYWLKSQATEEVVQDDGTIRQEMGQATKNLLGKLKTGSKNAVLELKEQGSVSQKFSKENFDLITWFIISK
jgi:hypothetical protein